MKNIFVNMESGDGVMIFTENEKITPEVVMAALLECGREVIEVYEVPEQDVRYYCYDPIWADEAFEANVLRRAEDWFEEHPRQECSPNEVVTPDMVS